MLLAAPSSYNIARTVRFNGCVSVFLELRGFQVSKNLGGYMYVVFSSLFLALRFEESIHDPIVLVLGLGNGFSKAYGSQKKLMSGAFVVSFPYA